MTNNLNNDRINWIDSLKGFSIFLVTIGHLGCNILVEKHIYSFHMFLFFFISGFLYKNKYSNIDYIKRKTKSILIPFLVWNGLSSIIYLILSGNFKDTVLGFILYDGKLSWNDPIWFLLALFFTEIIYNLINKNRIIIKVLILITSLLLWAYLGEKQLIFKINIIPIAIFFYCLGNIYNQIFSLKKLKLHRCFLLSIITSLLAINFIFGILLNERISCYRGIFGNYLYCLFAGICGVLLYFIIFSNFKLFNNNKILKLVGKNSLAIMSIQYFLFYSYNYFSLKYFNYDLWHSKNSIKALITAILTIILICLIVYLFKKIGKKSKIVNITIKIFGIR